MAPCCLFAILFYLSNHLPCACLARIITGTVELVLMAQGINAGVGLAALRAMRSLRIVKLVQELPSLQLVIGVIASAM